MNNLLFQNKAWEDYLYWQPLDKKTIKRINALLRDIARDPFSGISKPEPLRGDLSGVIEILSCRGHYN